MKKIAVLAIAFLLFIPFASINGSNVASNMSTNNILYVGGSGPNNYTSIQDAINDAKDGDTVFVYDDSSPYYESVVIDKPINLLGENKEGTVIDGSNEKRGEILEIRASYVNISYFTIRGGDNDSTIYHTDAIWLTSDAHHTRIIDCNIYNFHEGIVSHSEASNNFISNCKVWNCAGGISCGGEDKNGNYVISNSDFNSAGVCIPSSNNTILNCTFHLGKIWILDGSGNKLLNNRITGGAIQIEYSSHNILRNNTLKDSGFEIVGHGIENFNQDIDDSNIMHDKPIYYFYNKKDMIIDENSNTSYIILALCQNITVKNMELFGSVLAFSSNISFENCSFWGNSVGIYLHNSTYNSIHKCHFENYYPLMIEQSCRNNVSYCTFSGPYVHNIEIWHSSNENTVVGCTLNGNGIYLGDAHNNAVVKCTISDAGNGIEIDGNDNIVSLCNISHNNIGVFISGSSNKIYLNNFVGNELNAFCYYGQNIWNAREGGNYWDNYHGFDLNKDGIGFLPYHIKTYDIRSLLNFDWKPLMNPLKV